MFLDTMSPEAIVKEARRDTTAILNKRDFFINMHRREILFAKKFPVSFQIEWKSPLTHNQWHIIIACNNKKERENLDVYYYSTYETYRGAGIIFPVYNMRTEELVFSRYTGHFFSRYRTRHLVPNNLYTPGMDVIRHYVDHNSSYFYPQTDAEKRFTCCLTDGIALGICEKGLDTFRTFISHDMRFKIQERVLHTSLSRIQPPRKSGKSCRAGTRPQTITRRRERSIKKQTQNSPLLPTLRENRTGRLEEKIIPQNNLSNKNPFMTLKYP